MKYRVESDSIGSREVPAEAYYGVQSLRGQENFEILEYIRREDICEERDEVKEFSGSTWFWVIRKIN